MYTLRVGRRQGLHLLTALGRGPGPSRCGSSLESRRPVAGDSPDCFVPASQGWSSAYSIESVIMQISATLVKGKARVQFGANKVRSRGQTQLGPRAGQGCPLSGTRGRGRWAGGIGRAGLGHPQRERRAGTGEGRLWDCPRGTRDGQVGRASYADSTASGARTPGGLGSRRGTVRPPAAMA